MKPPTVGLAILVVAALAPDCLAQKVRSPQPPVAPSTPIMPSPGSPGLSPSPGGGWNGGGWNGGGWNGSGWKGGGWNGGGWNGGWNGGFCPPIFGPVFGPGFGFQQPFFGWSPTIVGSGYGFPYGSGNPYGFPIPLLPPALPPQPPVTNVFIVERDRREAAPPPAVEPAPAPTVRRGSRDRAEQMMTLGDRFFRAGELKRAEERYELAAQADPTGAGPRLRLAQLAVARGQWSEAADRLREAQAADPAWLIAADNVQALYAEPADFHAMLGTIEARVQAHPEDRDAWLVLGTQLFLSGRTDRAADVFLRLTDRPPDATLTALLDASRAR